MSEFIYLFIHVFTFLQNAKNLDNTQCASKQQTLLNNKYLKKIHYTPVSITSFTRQHNWSSQLLPSPFHFRLGIWYWGCVIDIIMILITANVKLDMFLVTIWDRILQLLINYDPDQCMFSIKRRTFYEFVYVDRCTLWPIMCQWQIFCCTNSQFLILKMAFNLCSIIFKNIDQESLRNR